MATGLGIDVGSRWIKIVQVRCSGKSVTVTGALKLPRSPEESEEGASFVPPTLGQELARAGLRRSGSLGISGREVMLKYLTTPPIPPDKLKMMIDMQIGDRLVPGQKGDGGSSLTYDYRLLNVPTGLKGDLVIAAGVVKNEYLYGVYSALKKAKVSITRTTPSAFGLVHAYLRTQTVPKGETVVLVDVGHELLELAILNEENLFFARSAPGGGKKFTGALNRLLKLSPEKIEEYKHHRARIEPEGAKLRGQQEVQFQKALKEGADAVAGSIRSAVMFCRTQAKMPKLDYQRIFISGGGARLKGLTEYLEGKTRRPVQVLDLYTGLDLRKLDAESARCFEGEVPDMAVALGLAVLDADPTGFHFSLVPESVVKKRVFWNKTVWAAAAGVVLMAGLWLPHKWSAESLSAVSDKKEDYEDRVRRAKRKQQMFKKRRADNLLLAEKVDKYAKQTRMGLVYLNLFTQVREHSPRGVTLVYMGPPQHTGLRGGRTLNHDVFEEPLRDMVLRGYYNTDEIKDFNVVTAQFFKQLELVQGVDRVELALDIDEKEFNPGPGQKAFQFNIRLGNPDEVLTRPDMPAAPKPDGKKTTGKSTSTPRKTASKGDR